MKLTRQRSVAAAADLTWVEVEVEVEAPKHAVALRPSPLSFSCTTASLSAVSSSQQSKSWVGWRHKVEDCLWLASAFFILYYGDFRSDFFTLLANDVRVRRTPLHMGLACLMLDGCVVMLYMGMGILQEGEQEGWLQAPGVVQAVTMLGSSAFILISVALWPIWNFLTVPMLFTLFMAFTVVAPYVLPKVKPDLFVQSSCEQEKP